MKAVLFLGQNVNKIDLSMYDIIIGVDKGAYILASNNIVMDYAVGDFDSISDLDLIKKYSKEFIKLNPVKDDTDTEHSLNLAYSLADDVTIIGGIQGRRVEHLIANICQLKKHPNLVIKDDFSMIFSIKENYRFYNSKYKFISFFAIEDSCITLKGFKYPLTNYELKMYDPLCISNEIVMDAELILLKGEILCIMSENDIEN